MEGYRLNPLLSREQIASIVKDLADQISKDYREKELVLVCILKGAFMFLSDLIRHLQLPVQIDFVRLASYGAGTKTSGRIEITKDIELSIEGKDVLIIEDIIDSGRTLQFLRDRLSLSNPRSVKICALLDKKHGEKWRSRLTTSGKRSIMSLSLAMALTLTKPIVTFLKFITSPLSISKKNIG
jgi:hypoxanthine phosphoribosyltransferase